MTFLEPIWLQALWLIPVLAAAQALWLLRRRRALATLIAEPLQSELHARVPLRRPALRAAFATLALALAFTALARPAWNPRPGTVTQSGRDVVFLVDVSRSMLAQDVAPNRLDRAKLAITDALRVAAGDRVALVAFAGTTVVKCPLTTDYSFFRLALDNLTPDSVSRGGTLIGDAIRTTLDQVLFPDADPAPHTADKVPARTSADIILFTDGEDHESFPVQAAQDAGRRAVRIIAVGLGSELEGAPVPSRDERGAVVPLRHDGEIVRSRLNAPTLQQIASATPGGISLNVGTASVNFDEIYARLVTDAEKTRTQTASAMKYSEGFQLLLLASFLLLLFEGFLRDART